MSEQNKQSKEQPKKPETKLDSLSMNIESLTKNIEKRQIARKQKKIKRRQELNDLYDAIEQKSNAIVSRIQDLTRKPTIIISVSKILPQIPETFPKNYNIQVVYEDVTVTGNQKFVDFDENLVDERYILPLLGTQTAKMEIWIAQQQPSLFDRCIINLQTDIQASLQDSNFTNQLSLEKNPSLSISYKVQLQGIGFSAWLKNIKSLRQTQQQRKKIRKQTQLQQSKTKEKIEQKKTRFNSKFKQSQSISVKTKQYNIKGIEQILDSLDD